MRPSDADHPVSPNSNSYTQSVLAEETPQRVADPPVPSDPDAETQTVVLEPTPHAVAEDAGTTINPEGVPNDADSVSEPEPKRRAETRRGPIGRIWTHRTTKVVVVCLAAVIAVVLVIWGIRLTHKSPDSSGPNLPTASTTTTVAASSKTAQTDFVLPVTSAQLAQYKQYAAAMETANTTAKAGLAGLGNPATVSQITPVATAYLAALNLYNLQIHYLQWPASMQADVAADDSQLSALINFVQSVGAVGPTGVNAWVAQLRTEAATTQAADNKLHRDLGLPNSPSIA